MLILALDSATQGCSVALWHDGIVLSSRDQVSSHRQSEILIPMIQAVREEAKIKFNDIDLFAVTVGPGSFTGVRIGLATARGLGLAAAKPIAGVTTMEATAYLAYKNCPLLNRERPIVVVIDSSRADVYVQVFFAPSALPIPLGPIQALLPMTVKYFLSTFPWSPTILVGDGTPKLDKHLLSNNQVIATPHQPRAQAVAAVAASREVSLGYHQRMTAVPIYLRAPL